MSHAAMTSEIDVTNELYTNQIIFSTSSLYYVGGVLALIVGTASGATRIITTKPFRPELQFDIIEKYKVTVVENQTYYLILMLKSGLLPFVDLSSVESLIASGIRVPFSVVEEVNAYLPNGCVTNLYGVADSTVPVNSLSSRRNSASQFDGFTVKIVDEHGNRCGVGVSGSICVKGRIKFFGYYKNKKQKDETVDSEGFFKTSDIGHIDEEGYLYIGDKEENKIHYQHHRVQPTEIEEVLLKSSEINDVCVVGIPHKSIVELPAAIVVRATSSKITADDVCSIVTGQFMNSHKDDQQFLKFVCFFNQDNMMGQFKLNGGVYFIERLPTFESGALDRNAVKEIATKLYRAKMENIQKPKRLRQRG